MRYKILITGPIADFGGREVEINTITKSLSKIYDVKLFSTGYMTKNSLAYNGLENVEFSSLRFKVCKKHFLINLFALISALKHRNRNHYIYSSNKLSKKIFKMDVLYKSVLVKELNATNLVIFCGQLSSGYLKFVLEFCKENNIKTIFRSTTESVNSNNLNLELFNLLDCYIAHSKQNSRFYFNDEILSKVIEIDQTCFNEKSLEKLKLNSIVKGIRYGFLGRFVEAKGIVPLINIFRKNKLPLYIGGSGTEIEFVEKNDLENENIHFLGKFDLETISVFFDSIDVLIIPSITEGGPLVAIEALAAGKVIISTAVGAMKDRLQNSQNNFWMDFNRFESLNEQINLLENMDRSEFNKIKKSNRELYFKRFSNKIIHQKYASLINEVLNTNS